MATSPTTVAGSKKFEKNFFDVYTRMLRSIPFFVASGNHDYETKNGKPFREVFALFENGGAQGYERWYSFDWGNVHFVVLDTEQIGRGAGFLARQRPRFHKTVVDHRYGSSSCLLLWRSRE